jgi:hypothetical protein
MELDYGECRATGTTALMWVGGSGLQMARDGVRAPGSRSGAPATSTASVGL